MCGASSGSRNHTNARDASYFFTLLLKFNGLDLNLYRLSFLLILFLGRIWANSPPRLCKQMLYAFATYII